MSVRAATLAALLALAAPAFAKPAAPVRSVSSPPAAAAPGAVTVKAKGTISLALSRDAKNSRDDLALGSARAREARAKARVRVPAGASGSYRLIACATARTSASRCT